MNLPADNRIYNSSPKVVAHIQASDADILMRGSGEHAGDNDLAISTWEQDLGGLASKGTLMKLERILFNDFTVLKLSGTICISH